MEAFSQASLKCLPLSSFAGGLSSQQKTLQQGDEHTQQENMSEHLGIGIEALGIGAGTSDAEEQEEPEAIHPGHWSVKKPEQEQDASGQQARCEQHIDGHGREDLAIVLNVA